MTKPLITGDCPNCKRGGILYLLVITRADGSKEIIKRCYGCRSRLKAKMHQKKG